MRVSILSAVHNEAAHIEEMIRSVLGQTSCEWELILVDDGSTDDTIAVAKAASNSDPRVNIFTGTGKIGKVEAFNRAFERSTGDIIVLLGGDDTLPSNSLEVRASALSRIRMGDGAVGFFKLRTISSNPKLHGAVIPRGSHGNRSGGTLVLNRVLAEKVFPIAENLVSEDIWIQHAAAGCADSIVESTAVVLNYRIHPGNSNPRGLPFDKMTESIHARQLAYGILLRTDRLSLNRETRSRLDALAEAEDLRYRGNSVKLLFGTNLPIADRLGFAAMSNPALYRLRTRFYALLSGLRRG